MCVLRFLDFFPFSVGLGGGFSVGGGRIICTAYFTLLYREPLFVCLVLLRWGGGFYASKNDGNSGLLLIMGRGWLGWRPAVVATWSVKGGLFVILVVFRGFHSTKPM